MDDQDIAIAAFRTGAFARILAPGSILTTDGVELHGRDECALYLSTLLTALDPDSVDHERINGEPGIALRRAGRVIAVAVVHGRVSVIDQLWLVTDAAKLRSWN